MEQFHVHKLQLCNKKKIYELYVVFFLVFVFLLIKFIAVPLQLLSAGGSGYRHWARDGLCIPRTPPVDVVPHRTSSSPVLSRHHGGEAFEYDRVKGSQSPVRPVIYPLEDHKRVRGEKR